VELLNLKKNNNMKKVSKKTVSTKSLTKAQFGGFPISARAAERKVSKGKGYFQNTEDAEGNTKTSYNAFNKKGREASRKQSDMRTKDINKYGTSAISSRYRPDEVNASKETRNSRPIRKTGGATKAKKK